MKILAFVNRYSVPAYHRIILPLLNMPGKDVDIFITNDINSRDMFKDIDLFIYNHMLPENVMNEIYILREQYCFNICLDTDDFWSLDRLHPFSAEYEKEKLTSKIITQIRLADFVTVTNDRLAKAVSLYNKRVHVLPNAIPKKKQFIPFPIEPHPKGLVRVFWQGSITHLPDIALLRKAIYQLEFTKKKNIEMVLGGHMEKEPIWQKIANIYTSFGNLPHCLIGGLEYDRYYQMYREADICLTPLVNSTFNRMKSNLKVLEAANLGLPVISSKVHPYLDLPVIYATTSQDWFNAILDLANNPNKRIEVGQQLKEFCNKHFNFDAINIERKQVYKFYNEN